VRSCARAAPARTPARLRLVDADAFGEGDGAALRHAHPVLEGRLQRPAELAPQLDEDRDELSLVLAVEHEVLRELARQQAELGRGDAHRLELILRAVPALGRAVGRREQNR
jgi:hypothetical protein